MPPSSQEVALEGMSDNVKKYLEWLHPGRPLTLEEVDLLRYLEVPLETPLIARGVPPRSGACSHLPNITHTHRLGSHQCYWRRQVDRAGGHIPGGGGIRD